KVIAAKMVKMLISQGLSVKGARVGILGLTFKENCPDLRNSKVVDVIKELQEFGVEVLVTDPVADPAEALEEYGLSLIKLHKMNNLDGLVLAVSHDKYRELNGDSLRALFASHSEKPVIVDVKSLLPHEELTSKGFHIWRL
ncbi:nucleotide sugar dehydrogenase, partial [Myxococcota bacterium]|nr:nucleotide sugar dehydrogenase [Myxococcota bacterium]